MANDFSLLRFVENTGNVLIQTYLEKQSIQTSFDEKVETETVMEFIKNLPSDQLRKVEEDFLRVNEMSDGKGTFDLLTEAAEQNINNIPELHGEEARAMWFFLEHPGVFEAAFVWDKINEFKNWQEEKIDNIDENTNWDGMAEDLADKFKKHYWEAEERRIECCTEVYKHQDRVSFVVYPEGYPKSVLKYNGGKVERHSARPIQEIYFVIHLKEKKLSVKSNTRFGWDRMKEIKGIFFENVLKQEFKDELTKEFELSHLLDENIGAFLKDQLPPGEEVDFVKIVEMTFKDKHYKAQTTILKANEIPGDPKEIFGMLRHRNIDPDYVYLHSVKIQVKFPGKGRIGSCTFGLAFPNWHDLGKDENSLKCRKYLKIWNIVKDE